MSRAIFILVIAALLFGCKKYRLNGDREILAGEWEWVSTVVEYRSSGGGSYLATPPSEDYTASISFAKRNKVVFSKDGTEVASGRIKIFAFEDRSGDPTYSWSGAFTLKEDGERKTYNFWIVKGNDDELRLREFPIEDDNAVQVWFNDFHRK
jgi:hypothetical protein